ncbi:MAG TPA: cytochrome b/b6 domain-containing protein [Thiobacillaceae bacterium]|nr:cytochrome b/b6 domain-containing protein [Thiobacillaceae bacterium]
MTYRRELVYDPVLRLIHAWNLLTILLLLLTGLPREWLEPGQFYSVLRRFHLSLGDALILGLVGRLVWGLVGPKHARLTELWRPRCWMSALRQRRLFTAPERFGHHGPATAAYLWVYGMLIGLSISGLALTAIKLGNGPFSNWLAYDMEWKAPVTTIHEILAYGVIAFIVLHLLALVVHHRRHGLPLAQSMVSGYQYLKEQ